MPHPTDTDDQQRNNPPNRTNDISNTSSTGAQGTNGAVAPRRVYRFSTSWLLRGSPWIAVLMQLHSQYSGALALVLEGMNGGETPQEEKATQEEIAGIIQVMAEGRVSMPFHYI